MSQEQFLVRFSRWILRHARVILGISFLLFLVGAYYSVHLYISLRPDLEQLLPKSARSVVDLDEVTRRFQALDHLAVVVLSKDKNASRRFVDDFVQHLKDNPRGIIDRVEYGIQEELKFFGARQALYLSLPDLISIRDYIQDKINYETELRNPLNIFENKELNEPHLNFQQLKKKYQSLVSTYTHFPDGYFATPSGEKRAVLVYMAGRISEIDRIKELKQYIDQVIAGLNPASYSKDLKVRFTGELENMLEEQASLTSDLIDSAVIVTLLVSLGMVAFFRSIRATFALVSSLFVGTAVTLGISYFLVGFLNANSAFLGSIVIGNGVNFGIIFLARYLEERRAGNPHEAAQYVSMERTVGATAVAALAAGLSYGSLVFTDFRGFSQFGLIGLLGMALCWIASYTVLPAFLGVLDQMKPLVHPEKRLTRFSLMSGVATFVSRYPKWISLVSVVITVASLSLFYRINSDLLEADLSKVRSKNVVEHGAGHYDHVIDEIFQRYLTPVVILPRSFSDTEKMRALLEEKKKQQGPDGMIARIQTIQDFVPKQQTQKIAILKEIHTLLTPQILKQLSPKDRALANIFLSKEALKPIHKENLPPLIRRLFTEKNGSMGKLILVEPPVREGPHPRPLLLQFVKDLRSVADSVAPGTPVAGAMPVSADILGSIEANGPRATLIAFISVVFLVIALFHRIRPAAAVVISLLVGVIWMMGAMLFIDYKINFLNFIAFPITFGIGVDYSVNIYQRYRQEKSVNIVRVIRNTGGAVGLCSLTTVIGYGSLLIAQSQAFVSFGVLAVLGEITCILVAIFALPATLVLKDQSIQRLFVRHHPEKLPDLAEESEKKAA